MSSILVIEDTDSLRNALCAVLTVEGHDVTAAASAEEALQCLNTNDFSLILSDLKLPGKSGLEFLQSSKQKIKSLPIIVMTAYGNIDIAVEAMKLGATDFITKPFDPEALCKLIDNIISTKQNSEQEFGRRARRQHRLITQNANVLAMLDQARKVAALSSPVLILGESGTGKELVARYIHEQSPRVASPFLAVNCGSMPSDLLESEFFGHEAGAFTGASEQRIGLFETASEGSIFLDEIANMPSNLQTKLLRTLQESEIRRIGATKTQKINTRIISATNCNIEDEISKGGFREDLYYRLSVVVLEIPPLRERPDDIELLANYYLKTFAKEFQKGELTFSNEALKLLNAYHWPGNVRELENTIERAVIFANQVIQPDALQLLLSDNSGSDTANVSLSSLTAEAIRKAETEAIKDALIKTRGNKSKASKLLGVSYKTLLNKIKEYQLG